MSIIYDALQKAQKKRENQTLRLQPKIQSSRNWRRILMLSFACITVVIFVSIVISQIDFHQIPKSKSIPVTKPEKKMKLLLNGVLLSNETNIAMINNKPFSVGDKIDEMTIISIDQEKVVLKNDERELSIKIGV